MPHRFSYEAEYFKMPGLSKYWCFPDGRVWHIVAEYFMDVQDNGCYHTYDDNYDLSPTTPDEIICYYKHLQQMFKRMEAEETETVIYRPYPEQMHAIVDSEGCAVMLLNNDLLNIALKTGIPQHYKIEKY